MPTRGIIRAVIGETAMPGKHTSLRSAGDTDKSVHVRLSAAEYARLAAMAEGESRSLTAQVRVLLTAAMAANKEG